MTQANQGRLPGSTALRRRLAGLGLVSAARPAAAAWGRTEAARTQPARLVEDGGFRSIPVGPAEPCPAPLAFLDGIQRQETLGYAGAMPLILAEVAAGVRLRDGGRLRTVAAARRRLVLGRPAALEAARDALAGLEAIPLPADGALHPVRDLEAAHHLVDEARAGLEARVGRAFRREWPDAWLIVDGSLTESPAWAADGRMLGVAKSHATLPFDGPDLQGYLHLAPGHRTPVFQPGSRRYSPVFAWALRLWPWEGRDIFHGLIRVEAAPTPATLGRVDEYCRWLLAERAPASTPDPRWDRLLYGVRGVEEWLRAGGATTWDGPGGEESGGRAAIEEGDRG